MLVDLDCLKGHARNYSPKWVWLARAFDPRLITRPLVREIAIFVNTEGVGVGAICPMMLWHPGFYEKCVAPLIAGADEDPEIIAEAALNAASVTAEDGRDMLVALGVGHRRNRVLRGSVPIFGTMWLQEQWRMGRKEVDIAAELQVSVGTVQNWKHANGFAPNHVLHRRIGALA